MGEVAGLEPLLEPRLAVDRADSVRLALAYMSLLPLRAVVVAQHVRGSGDPRSGEWLLAWVRAKYPLVARILVVDPWNPDPAVFEASGLAQLAVGAGTPLAELAEAVLALALARPLTRYRMGHRAPERPWSRPRPPRGGV